MRDAGNTGVRVRPATPEDAAAIHSMILALARDIGSEGRVSSRPEDFREAATGDRPAFEALIAERDGAAVGLCLYFFSFSSWRGERGVYLQDIWVDGPERGSGLAQRLIGEVARQAAERGARFMRLSVDRENQAARSFYTRLGLGHSARECIYMATGAAFETLTRVDPSASD